MNDELNRAGRRYLRKHGLWATVRKGLCGLKQEADGTFAATLPPARNGEKYVKVGEVHHRGVFVADLCLPWALCKAITRHQRFMASKA